MTETIFLVDDPSYINELKEEISHHRNSKTFSLNYQTHRTLKKNGIPHEIGEDYLRDTDEQFIDNESIRLTLTWWDHDQIRDSFKFKGINLVTLIEMELQQYLSQILRSIQIIKRILINEKPKKIIVH